MADFSDFWANVAGKMPSKVPFVKSLLFSGSQMGLGRQQSYLGFGNAPSCPNAQLSCHNTSVVEDLCCFNAPGGQMLATQFWDTNPPTGPDDAWTIHGLWPDRCDGTYDANCDNSRAHGAYSNIVDILQKYGQDELLSNMTMYWKDYQGDDQNLWKHEWSKHGTCVSTLEPTCYQDYRDQEEVVAYFQTAVDVYKTRPTYEWLYEAGIVPSTQKTYTRDQIQSVLTEKHGRPVTLGCKSGKLDEVWYHFDVRGSVQTGEFVAADPDGGKSTCPASGIKYPPKGSSNRPTHTTAHSRTHAPTPTGPPFSGKGHLNVKTSGRTKGCIISGGTWYTSGTCATFRATSADEGFSLSSNKGKCAVIDGALTCSATVDEATVFESKGTTLGFSGNTTFYADSVPRGFRQLPVYVVEGRHGTDLTIEWQGA